MENNIEYYKIWFVSTIVLFTIYFSLFLIYFTQKICTSNKNINDNNNNSPS